MTDRERYDRLYAHVRGVEEKHGCPWMERNAWFNTDGDGFIDMETMSGCAVTDDMEAIDRLLALDGLELRFEGDAPRIAKKGESV